MSDPIFFTAAADGLTLAEIAAAAGASLPDGADPERRFSGAASLESAGPEHLAYMDNARYGDALAATRAGVCLVSPRFAARCPATTVALVSRDPYRAYAALLGRLHPMPCVPAPSSPSAASRPAPMSIRKPGSRTASRSIPARSSGRVPRSAQER